MPAGLDCSRPLPKNSCSATGFLTVMLWEAASGRDVGECVKARAALKAWLGFFLMVGWGACLCRDRSAASVYQLR